MYWREACEDVAIAYEHWGSCATPQHGLAVASYRAALNREEHDAQPHRACASRLAVATVREFEPWVCPRRRAFAMAPPDEQRQPVVRPGPDEPASYEQHVRTFFRKKDRDSTQRAFDLWS